MSPVEGLKKAELMSTVRAATRVSPSGRTQLSCVDGWFFLLFPQNPQPAYIEDKYSLSGAASYVNCVWNCLCRKRNVISKESLNSQNKDHYHQYIEFQHSATLTTLHILFYFEDASNALLLQ